MLGIYVDLSPRISPCLLTVPAPASPAAVSRTLVRARALLRARA